MRQRARDRKRLALGGSARAGLLAIGVLVGLAVLAPAPASAASAGLKPSEAPLISVGQHYFGNTTHEWNAGCCNKTFDLWHLPPLLTADVLTVAWHAESGITRWCIVQDVDDFNWAEHISQAEGDDFQCNGSNVERVSANGNARTTVGVRSATTNGYLEFIGGGAEYSTGSYDFTIESIQHAVGVGLTPVTEITPTSVLTGSANLSTGSPVPDGLAFTLSASWVTPVNKASHSRSYTVTSTGGALAFPLSLPSSAQGKHVSLTVTRPADPQYLAASSPAIEVTVAKLAPPPQPHRTRHCRRGFRKHKVHGQIRCVRKHHRHRHGGRHRATMAFALSASPTVMVGTSNLQQQCVQAGLVMPQILHKPEMRHAGIRALTRQHLPGQYIGGEFEYPVMPDGCAPQFERVSLGQLQMQKRHDRSVWINNGPRGNPGHIGNQGGSTFGRAELAYSPSHAWPAWLFNECEGSQGWLKVRDILTVLVKDEQTHEVVGQKNYTLPIKVSGSCAAARRSAEITKGWPLEPSRASAQHPRHRRHGATNSHLVIGDCQSTDDPSPHPQRHMHLGFRALGSNHATQTVRPGGIVRFVNQVAGGNLDAFYMQVNTAPIFKFPKDMEVLKRGSHPAWSKAGGAPKWTVKNLCHWKDKRHISFLVKVRRQAKAGERLCMPYSVWARTGSNIEPYAAPVQRLCLRVK